MSTAETVRLRVITPADVEALTAMYLDPDAAGEQNWFGHAPAKARRMRERVAGGETIGDQHGSLAVEAADGTLVGEVSWNLVDNSTPPNGRCWNVGILVLPAHRGRGYGSAAQRAMAEYLFAHTPAERVQAGTEAGNVPERRALLRAGFTEEGVLRSAVFRGGAYRDMVMFSLLRNEL
jgi:RimJ/RimL family protein N-acetyltransferase